MNDKQKGLAVGAAAGVGGTLAAAAAFSAAAGLLPVVAAGAAVAGGVALFRRHNLNKNKPKPE